MIIKGLLRNDFDGHPKAGLLWLWKSSRVHLNPVVWSAMGKFGEDLRSERLSRGVALEQITAVTKISQRHLLALEQERFGQLPGGILNKGIVRGYAGALGLDEHDWTERFLTAYRASVQPVEEEDGWTAFATNVGRARIQRHEAQEMRVRWAGAVVLLLAVLTLGFFGLRYLGVRSGWWPTVLPSHVLSALVNPVHMFFTRMLTHI
jgi:cytoskeleton protein RodZ